MLPLLLILVEMLLEPYGGRCIPASEAASPPWHQGPGDPGFVHEQRLYTGHGPIPCHLVSECH